MSPVLAEDENFVVRGGGEGTEHVKLWLDMLASSFWVGPFLSFLKATFVPVGPILRVAFMVISYKLHVGVLKRYHYKKVCILDVSLCYLLIFVAECWWWYDTRCICWLSPS